MDKREPKIVENAKSAIFLRGERTSNIIQLVLTELRQFKKPFDIHFTKKNKIHPFEDPASLEFFSEKNDAALLLLGVHSKKRPHCLTIARCFNHKLLDMLELYVDAESFRTLSQFKNAKCATGIKPMISFSGTAFESPISNAYTMAKSMFLDLFRGEDASSVDVEGLQVMIHIAAGEEVDGEPPPMIHMRVYRLTTKNSGQKLPRIETEEIGPRISFRVGRVQEADEKLMSEALKKPKQLEPKRKKNVDMDEIGDKIGRVHVGKQNLSQMQTRKMKGLKRPRDENGKEVAESGLEIEEGGPVKRPR